MVPGLISQEVEVRKEIGTGYETSLDGRQGRGSSAETQTPEWIYAYFVWFHWDTIYSVQIYILYEQVNRQVFTSKSNGQAHQTVLGKKA